MRFAKVLASPFRTATDCLLGGPTRSLLRLRETGGVFYNPPTHGDVNDYTGNPAYSLGDAVQLRWSTAFARFHIVLWQNDNPDYEFVQVNITGLTSYVWIASTTRNVTRQPVFFFEIRNAEDLSQAFSTHYFNLTGKEVADPSGTRPPQTTATTTTTSLSSVVTSPTLTASFLSTFTPSTVASTVSLASSSPAGASPGPSQPTSGPAQEGALSNTTKRAVGAGVGAGIALLAGGCGILWYIRRRRRARRYIPSDEPKGRIQTPPALDPPARPDPPYSPIKADSAAAGGVYEASGRTSPKEMEVVEARYELAAS